MRAKSNKALWQEIMSPENTAPRGDRNDAASTQMLAARAEAEGAVQVLQVKSA